MNVAISKLLFEINIFDGNSWANFFLGLWERIGRIFYTLIIVALGRVADICQLVFKKLAGISPSGVSFGNGEAVQGDIVLAFINSDIVKNVFFSMLILAVVLLLITTFAATIKTEFAKDGNNNKRAVIKNAFRGLANFALVPIICIFGLFVGNGLLKAIDGATSLGGATTLSSQIFLAGGYNANRARKSQTTSEDGDFTYEPDSFGEKLKLYGNFGVFLDDTSGINKQSAADKIDACFGQNYLIEVGTGAGTIQTKVSGFNLATLDGGVLDALIPAETITTDSNIINYYETGLWHGGACAGDLLITAKINAMANDSVGDNLWVNSQGLIKFNEGDYVYCSIYNIGLVYYYYDLTLTGFDYIITTICLVFCAYTLVVAALGLIKRLFMLTTLFIISPPVSATYPLDNGEILKRWRTEFIKQSLSAYSTVVIINLFLLLLRFFLQMNFFTSWADLLPLPIPTGLANYLARVLIIIGALVFFKEGSASISQIIGANDAMNDGIKNAKAFAGGVKRVVGGGAAVAGATMGAGKFINELDRKRQDNSFRKKMEASSLAVADAEKRQAEGVTLTDKEKNRMNDAKKFLDNAVIKRDKDGNIDYRATRLATEDKAFKADAEKREEEKRKKYSDNYFNVGEKAFKASMKKGEDYDVAVEKADKARRKFEKRFATSEKIKHALSSGVGAVVGAGKATTGFLKNAGGKTVTAARSFGDSIQGLVKGDLSMKDAYETGTEGGSRKMREKEKKVKEKTATAEMQKNIRSMASNQSSSSSSQDFANREMKDKLERLEKGIDEIKDNMKKKK